MLKKPLILVVLALLYAFPTLAQVQYTVASGSKAWINGTSSLHNWESEVTGISGKATFGIEQSTLSSLENLEVQMEVKSIKSGKKGMDNNTYKALKAETYPFITFKLTSVNSMKTTAAGCSIDARGNLTIAGTTKPISLTVEGISNPGGIWVFKGSKTIKMTDYNVDPPTALMGTIKTGDELKINFDVPFKQPIQ
jgi:polyisoprenoid-binding protein YceI